jgi:hypothetical protein
MDARLAELERQLTELEEKRARAQRWAPVFFAAALIGVISSLMLMSARRAGTQTARPPAAGQQATPAKSAADLVTPRQSAKRPPGRR